MKTHRLIFRWQRIVISNHTAQHISGLILRKRRCCPRVKPVKKGRIRCSVCKRSWRAGERSPGPMAARRHRQKRESGEAGAPRYLAMTFTCSPSHTEGFGSVQINAGCPCVVLLWPQLFTRALVTLSWSPTGASMLLPAHQSSSWSYFSWPWHLPRLHFLLTHGAWLVSSELIISPSQNLLLLIRRDLFWE